MAITIYGHNYMGLKGAIVIHKRQEPHASMYSDERVVAISDEWAEPEVP